MKFFYKYLKVPKKKTVSMTKEGIGIFSDNY